MLPLIYFLDELSTLFHVDYILFMIRVIFRCAHRASPKVTQKNFSSMIRICSLNFVNKRPNIGVVLE